MTDPKPATLDWRALPELDGHTIDIARIDWQLLMWTDHNVQITVGGDLEVTRLLDGAYEHSTFAMDVEARPLPAPMAGVEGSTIRQAHVTREGHLCLTLDDIWLTAAPHPKYESWQLNWGSGNEMFICGPGGRFTHFAPIRR